MFSFFPYPVLPFILAFGEAFLLGALCYAMILLTRDKAQDFFLVLVLFITVPISFFSLVVVIPAAVVISVLCIWPARLERRMAGIHLFTKDWHYVRLCFATYLSVVVALSSWFWWQMSSGRNAMPDLEVALLVPVTLGSVLTPSTISLVRWLLFSSRMRPGIDRHLHAGEESEGAQQLL